MSLVLYRLGRWSYRSATRVIAAWIALVLALGVAAFTLGGTTQDDFSIPGTEAQDGLDTLNRTFPELAGTSAFIIVVAPDGRTVDEIEGPIESVVDELSTISGVTEALSPFDEISDINITEDRTAAMVQMQFDQPFTDIDPAVIEDVTASVDPLTELGYTAQPGGELYTDGSPHLSIIEVFGVIVAFGVLLLMFRSVRTAVIPIVTALVGVAITMAITFTLAGFWTISSTAPLLALMLGLAVGIDYALFILARQRELIADGIEPEEAAARAIATAGTAVAFAGLTTMIALIGLAIARIPFLTVMGLIAALGVTIAVLVSATLLPALMGRAGERLRPRPRRSKRPAGSFARRWVRGAMRWPVATLVVLIVGLGVLILPAQDLRLALPDNGSQPAEAPSRIAYDLVAEEFGPGYNGPLLVIADIISSTDPVGVMDDLAADLAAMDGVETIGLATPNPRADTGAVQVIPAADPTDAQTADLVTAIRDRAAEFEESYGTEITVTGFTAAGIDVSDRLGDVLVPFGLFVVGQSLLVLAMTFRSWLIPLKATVGYLLSVGVSFGAVVAVFQWGWFGDLVNLDQPGPVISFLPIVLMAVLFGLAMDYEVFLVSRMKEEHASGRPARAAIEGGFVSSSRVVTAAALIMLSVFAAFVPTGDPNIKPIAFALAIGVFVDAFIVRMLLVPAALALLGEAAWRLPRLLDRLLPVVDVEGDEVRTYLALDDWPAPDDRAAINAEGLGLAAGGGPVFSDVDLRVADGDWLIVAGPDHSGKTSLLLTLAGRMASTAGRLRVAGHLLPYGAHDVRRTVGLAEFEQLNALEDHLTIGQHIAERFAALSAVPRPRRGRIAAEVAGLNRALQATVGGRALDARTPVSALTRHERKALGVTLALLGEPTIVVVDDVDALRSSSDIAAFWDTLALLTRSRGITVVAGVQSATDAPERSYATVVELPAQPRHDLRPRLDPPKEFVDS